MTISVINISIPPLLPLTYIYTHIYIYSFYIYTYLILKQPREVDRITYLQIRKSSLISHLSSPQFVFTVTCKLKPLDVNSMQKYVKFKT